MAQYKCDLDDIYFNLFQFLKVYEGTEFEESDLREVIVQFENFVKNEIYPTRQESDALGVKLTGEGVVVPEILHKAKKAYYENGWYGLGVAEELGGMPVPAPVAFACDSLYVGSNVGFSMYSDLTRGAMNVILKVGDQKQKDKIVPKMMDGTWGGTMCLTESGAGSDVGAVKTSAKPLGENLYSISGVKIFISSGESDLFENNIHLVLAKTPGAPEGTKGLSLFLVPRYNYDDGKSNNVFCTKIEEKMGIHASSTCELTFGQNGECVGELIGKEFEGMQNMFIMMNEARLLCGTQGESQANLAYELTKQYCSERSQFGVTIEKHPDVAKTLLKMRALGRGMRALILYTSKFFDLKDEERVALLTPVCKSYCSEMGFHLSVDAVQCHGGYGFCSEYGIEQFVRDTKIATIYEGTNAIQANDFLLRKILGDEGKTLMGFFNEMKTDLAAFQESFPQETLEVTNSLKDFEKIMQKVTVWAKEKNYNQLMYVATDLLRFNANLFTAWLLGKQAMLAQSKMKTDESKKEYYESKLVDFNTFCKFYLIENRAISSTLLNF